MAQHRYPTPKPPMSNGMSAFVCLLGLAGLFTIFFGVCNYA